MPTCALYLAGAAGLLLAATAAALSAAVPQAQKVEAAPGSSVRVECTGNASGGGDWSLLDTLSNLLLGDDDDEDDDQRSESAEDDYYNWLGLDDSSEESGSREPTVPSEVSNNSVARHRRATPSWGLGDVDVQGGKDWSVRLFNWMMVRRNPATDRVEVKILMPNVFSPGANGEGEDADGSSFSGGAGALSGNTGGVDVQGGKNWSVNVFNWVLARRNPTTGQVEVKLQVPGLYSPTGGGDDGVDGSYVGESGRVAGLASNTAGAAKQEEDGVSRLSSS